MEKTVGPSIGTNSELDPPPAPAAGDLLRFYRRRAGLSQLQTALMADISMRHLSYLENGRSAPGEGVLMKLAEVLQLDASDRNSLRVSAGLRHMHGDLPASALQVPDIRRALDLVLSSEPHLPKVVKDPLWDLVALNPAAAAFLARFTDADHMQCEEPLNSLELIFSQHYLRPWLSNWAEVAGTLIARIKREIGFAAQLPEFVERVEHARQFEGFGRMWAERGPDVPAAMVYRFKDAGGGCAEFEAVIMSLGAPHDAVLNGIRVETFFPKNQAAADLCSRLLERVVDTKKSVNIGQGGR